MADPDIFISYAAEDRETARRLAAELETERGWSVWWDREIPVGRRFDQVIARALGRARCVVVLWSRAAIRSRWVRDEASDAESRGVLVPARIEDVELPLGFRSIQTSDLTGWLDGEPDEESDRFFASLEHRIRHGPQASGMESVAAIPREERFARLRRWLPSAALFLVLAVALVAVGLLLGDRLPGRQAASGPEVPVAETPADSTDDHSTEESEPEPARPEKSQPESTAPGPVDSSPADSGPVDSEPAEPVPPPPPPPSGPRLNPRLPLFFDEEREIEKKFFGLVRGQVSDGPPARITGTFTLRSARPLQGVKAFVLLEVLDERGNVLHHTKARTWVEGKLIPNRSEHSVSVHEEIPEPLRLRIHDVRVRFEKEE